MNILVIGGGAREHATVWKCVQSELADRVYCAPGNAGIGMIAKCVDIRVDDLGGLLEFVFEKHIDLTIVGPELPLVAGIVDRFEEAGAKILGPSKAASLVEGSKLYAKSLMKAHGIPTADFAAFTDVDPALVAWMAGEHIKQRGAPCVIKADGLASGKGVVVARTMEEALSGVENLARLPAGRTLLVEDMLEGWECSYIVLTDGEAIMPLVSARDYKRAYDGNLGPNTGGMGAFAPTPRLTRVLDDEIRTIVANAFSALKKEGIVYKGFLYAGLMITKDGPKVLEFNCRLGDPEAQVILPILESDFVDVCVKAVEGRLSGFSPAWKEEAAVDVVVASPGYPENPRTGDRIYGLEEAAKHGALVFHAGTDLDEAGHFITSGGRVLSVAGHGANYGAAREMAYRACREVSFGDKNPEKGKQWYRKDIAQSV